MKICKNCDVEYDNYAHTYSDRLCHSCQLVKQRLRVKVREEQRKKDARIITCSECHQVKPQSIYYPKWCKDCQNAYNRKMSLNTPGKRERAKASAAQFRKTEKYKESIKRQFPSIELKFRIAIKSSLKRNIEFKLTFEQFKELIDQPCHYCLRASNEKHGYRIDRKNSSKDYTIDNVVPCCSLCNSFKGKDRVTYEQMKIIGKHLANAQKELERFKCVV